MVEIKTFDPHVPGINGIKPTDVIRTVEPDLFAADGLPERVGGLGHQIFGGPLRKCCPRHTDRNTRQ
jgi:hypothetical protein